MARNTPQTGSGGGPGALITFLIVVGVGGILWYNYVRNDIGPYEYTREPQEYDLTYVPSQYRIPLEAEEIFPVLADPERFPAEFDRIVYDLNTSILRHVARRMDLSEEKMRQVDSAYMEHHPYLRKLYYQDFLALKDTSSNLYQVWYENEASRSTEFLEEVASKYTCFLVNHVMVSILDTDAGRLYAKGINVDNPCGVALTEALRPAIKRLKERAAIRDFGRSRGLMQERVEKAIAELATMEVRDKKGLNKRLQTRILGYAVSTTDIEISAISILKVGYRLNEYFNLQLDGASGTVILTLPEPRILSHEVYPRMDKLDVGWLREVQDADLNRAFDALRADFRQDALESDIMEKSRRQADELMHTLLDPMLNGLNPRFQLEVRFRQNESGPEFPEFPAPADPTG